MSPQNKHALRETIQIMKLYLMACWGLAIILVPFAVRSIDDWGFLAFSLISMPIFIFIASREDYNNES